MIDTAIKSVFFFSSLMTKILLKHRFRKQCWEQNKKNKDETAKSKNRVYNKCYFLSLIESLGHYHKHFQCWDSKEIYVVFFSFYLMHVCWCEWRIREDGKEFKPIVDFRTVTFWSWFHCPTKCAVIRFFSLSLFLLHISFALVPRISETMIVNDDDRTLIHIYQNENKIFRMNILLCETGLCNNYYGTFINSAYSVKTYNNGEKK